MSIRGQRGYDLTGWEGVLTGLLEMSDEEARLTVLFRNGLIDAAELCERMVMGAENARGARILMDASDYLCCVIEGDA